MTILVVTGGVGGAKLALGLSHVLPPEELIFLVNTGDDFEHLGFHISPDIDTLIYTLAGIVDRERGWGRDNDSWHCLESLHVLGEPTWFRLGDKDLAIHISRTTLLNNGYSLTEAMEKIRTTLGVKSAVLPASDDVIRTFLHTTSGRLAFQDYFVRQKCEPTVTRIEYEHSQASLNSKLELTHIDAVIICPSNPYLSIGPILAIREFSEFLKCTNKPVIAVSPVIDGKAVKGPTAKIMQELGIDVTPTAIAKFYQDLISGLVIDQHDIEFMQSLEELGVSTSSFQTLMYTQQDRINLALHTIDFMHTLSTQ